MAQSLEEKVLGDSLGQLEKGRDGNRIDRGNYFALAGAFA